MKLLLKWFGALLLLALLAHLVGLESLYNAIQSLPVSVFLLLVFLTVVARAFFAETLKFTIRCFGYSFSSWESLVLVWVRGYFNQFLPSAGMGVVAVYLSKIKNIDFSDYIASNIAVTFSQYISGGILLLLLSLPLALSSPENKVWLLVVLSLISIAFSYFILRFGGKFKVLLPAFLNRKLSGVHSSWERLQSVEVHAKLVILNAVPFVIRGLRIWVIFNALGFDLGIIAAVILSVTADIMTVLSITPAALGVRELIFSLCASLFGLTFEQMLIVALIDRAVMVLTLMFFGQLSLLYLSAKVKNE